MKEKINTDHTFDECPRNKSNIFGKLLFSWVDALVWKGYKKPLQITDLYQLPPEFHAANVKGMNIEYDNKTKYPLVKFIYLNIILKSYLYIVVKLFSAALSVLIPFALKMFIAFIQSDKGSQSQLIGWLICIALFIGSLSLTFSVQHCYWMGILISTRVKTSLIYMIYVKMLKLSNSSKKIYNVGKIMNLISVDVDAFSKFFWNDCIDIFVNPLKIVGLLIFLCITVGWSGLVGFGLMIVALPINIYMNDILCEHFAHSLKYSDERLGYVSELVSGIRFLKLYTWETLFQDKITRERKDQMDALTKRNIYLIIIETLNQVLGGAVLFITFLVFIYQGNEFTAEVAFTSLMIFVSLRSALQTLPDAFQKAFSLKESSHRVESYFKAKELEYISHPTTGTLKSDFEDVEIIGGEFSWGDSLSAGGGSRRSSISSNISLGTVKKRDKIKNKKRAVIAHSRSQLGLFGEQGADSSLSSEQDFHLNSMFTLTQRRKRVHIKDTRNIGFRDLYFKAPSGKLTIIVGGVGSGKSSLISALLGEMNKIEGILTVPKNIAYAPQQPFLQTLSIRDNILFGKAFDMTFYKKVIQACSLDVDLGTMPGKDMTEIGEKGISLSGGQKQRISLARALYSNADCYILDDPLNAVDSQVAKHLFNHCIQGILKDKTRILITHQLQFLPLADSIVVVDHNKLTQGTYDELIQMGIDFTGILDNKNKSLNIHQNNNNNININDNEIIQNNIGLNSSDNNNKINDNNNNIDENINNIDLEENEIIEQNLSSKTLIIPKLDLSITNNNDYDNDNEIKIPENTIQMDELSSLKNLVMQAPNTPGRRSKLIISKEIQNSQIPPHSPAITSKQVSIRPKIILKRNDLSVLTLDINSVVAEEHNQEELKRISKQLVEESREVGAVDWRIYKEYFKSSKRVVVLLFSVVFYFLAQLVFQGASYWLTVWTQSRIQPHPGDKFYILIYGGFMVVFTILYPITISLLSNFTLNSSKNLHKNLLESITNAPCKFFDQNSSGSILNRFSVDISDIDILTLKVLSNILYCGSAVVVSLGLMIYVNYYLAIPIFIAALLYYFIQVIFRSTARELKRLESISRSPLYGFLAESFNGLQTIRSFSQQERFINEFSEKLDYYQRICFYSAACYRWIDIRLDIFASIIVLCASVFSIYSSSMNTGLAGFIVTTSFSLTGNLSWVVRQLTEFEVKMNSVERIISFVEVPSESEMAILNRIKYRRTINKTIKSINQISTGSIGRGAGLFNSSSSSSSTLNMEDKIIEIKELPKKQPSDFKFTDGELKFENVIVKYAENKSPVLKEINFQINAKEKVGIVGRTGSGKSTIGISLFRMIEAHSGSITIDQCNIGDMNLKDLRRQIGVIPQEPFLFSGTIRSNIDPLDEHYDEEIWSAIEKVKLKEIIKSQPLSIDTLISGNDDIFSIGQKQLLSLCRVLIKDYKIILMDEATSNLDFQTDCLIKQVVRDNFKNSTLLTIAHRLDTIIDYDKILVIDNGKVAEFDSPINLLNQPNSKFSKLLASQTHSI